nr:hypothetical protein [Pseudomonas sp. BIGb0427]
MIKPGSSYCTISNSDIDEALRGLGGRACRHSSPCRLCARQPSTGQAQAESGP